MWIKNRRCREFSPAYLPGGAELSSRCLICLAPPFSVFSDTLRLSSPRFSTVHLTPEGRKQGGDQRAATHGQNTAQGNKTDRRQAASRTLTGQTEPMDVSPERQMNGAGAEVSFSASRLAS